MIFKQIIRAVRPIYGNQRGGLNMVQAAFTLPIIVAAILGGAWIYLYIRNFTVLGHIAQKAADIASSHSLNPLPATQDNAPLRAYPLASYWDQCAGTEDAVSCFSAKVNEARTGAIARSGLSDFSDQIAKIENLPFSLFERSTDVHGYFPVQTLPLIGIERGCFEPYNESGAAINTATRLYNEPDANLVDDCRHVKPMYWQSPVKADFDGDRREDLVFFKPTGENNTTWGDQAEDSESDFIVYHSGWGFSGALNKHGYFNLTTERIPDSLNPPALPIVADYDRDSISDYAIFEPATGTYRIALSSRANRVILEGSAGADFTDLLGEKGLIAIPGNWRSSTAVDIAVIKTAGAAAGRYDIYLTDLAAKISKNLEDHSYPTQATTVAVLTSGDSTLTAATVKPHRGDVAVPAPGDYDDDGITEMGYLSFSGGNLAKWIAGLVPDSPLSPIGTLFPGAAVGLGPKSIRINPFDMDFDSSGNLYYMDAADGRLWKLSTPGTAGDFAAGNPSLVFPVVAHKAFPSGTQAVLEARFPLYNVLNVPIPSSLAVGPTTESEYTDELVSTRGLKSPRKFVIGPDDVAYVADFGNRRIIRVEPSSGSLSSSSSSKVVLGSMDCTPATCPALSTTMSGAAPADGWAFDDDLNNGYVRVRPIALEVIPHPTNADAYNLAFSDGYAVFLLTHSGAEDRGPIGESGETIYKIAGTGSAAASTGSGVSAKWTNISSTDPSAANLCTVVDLKYSSLDDGLLYIATSCNTGATITSNMDLTTSNVGGILKLKSDNGDFNDNDSQLSVFAGGFWDRPCQQASRKCSGPFAAESATSGLYQRKVDLTASAADISTMDLINPVDMEIGADNSLFFINQWNAASESDSDKYTEDPQRTDYQHQQGVYRLELDLNGDATDITALTNPFQWGSETVPVESVYWRSPHTAGDTFTQFITPHEAPAKNFPLPAVAGLALDPNGERLYTSTPFMRNVHPADHPYLVDAHNIGFIYKIDLDLDGDGTFDADDSDIDGDAKVGDIQNFCANPRGLSCRMQEKVGNPLQYFFKLDGAVVDLSLVGGPTNKTYGEYFLLNSVSECGDEANCLSDGVSSGIIVRPEVWATMLNFGDDQDFDWESSKICDENLEVAVLGGGAYDRCKYTGNGPIAAPASLDTFAGEALQKEGDNDSYSKSIVPAGDSMPDQNVLFPVLLSSTMPRENGIKPVRRKMIEGDENTKTAGIRESGVICLDAGLITYNDAAPGRAVRNSPYTLATAAYLRTELTSGLLAADDYWVSEEESADNDSLNYSAVCGGSDSLGAVEAVVLQLDNDETAAKVGDGSGHFPHAQAVGDPGVAENLRQFLMLDLDGDGVRDPGYLTSDSLWVDPDPSFEDDGPFTFIGLDLDGVAERFQAIREPWTSINFLNEIGVVEYSFDDEMTGTMKPAYYGMGKGEGEQAFNFSFDHARQAANTLETVAVALDFEPLVARGYNISSEEDVGAAMYAEHLSSDRLKTGATVAESAPALIAASNLLRISLGLEASDITLNRATFDAGSANAFISLVNTQTKSLACDPDSLEPDQRCDSVQVSRRINIFGKDVEVTRYGAISSGVVNTSE